MDKTATEVVFELLNVGMQKEADIGTIRNIPILKDLLKRSRLIARNLGIADAKGRRNIAPGSIADMLSKGKKVSPDTVRGSLPRTRGRDIFDNVSDADLIDVAGTAGSLSLARSMRSRARQHMYNNMYDMINGARPTNGLNWRHYKKWLDSRARVSADDLNDLTDMFVK